MYFEFFPNIEEAIDEEKRIKGGNRILKIKLITDLNPSWSDLSETFEGDCFPENSGQAVPRNNEYTIKY